MEDLLVALSVNRDEMLLIVHNVVACFDEGVGGAWRDSRCN